MSNRKAWLSASLALGALAASGGVAMAAHNEEPERKVKDASQSLQVKHSEGDDSEKSATKEEAKAVKAAKAAKGQVCLKLDKKAQKLIADAGVVAKGGTVTVPLNKVKVVRCKSTSKPAPAPKPTRSAPAPKPAPKPTRTAPAPKPPAPKPPAPKPIVTSTAS